jgi:hypothetical protein
MRTATLLLALLLEGCSNPAGCFVGVSVFPPGPFVVCGVDVDLPQQDEKGDSGV